mmetsp:Transcript_4036/g.11704  ORF Transcript_4036/g.11704 Transcript_4036/m.11704 type:complete len:263 (+) Transcript_4036:129-917(+)
MATARFGLWFTCVVACLAASSALEIKVSRWMDPAECISFELPSGLPAQSHYQLLPASENTPLRFSSMVSSRCLESAKDGSCVVSADASPAACRAATSENAAGSLEGDFESKDSVPVMWYVRNTAQTLTLLDTLIVVQPLSESSDAAVTSAVGGYRRALLSGTQASSTLTAAADISSAVPSLVSLRGSGRMMLQAPTASNSNKLTWKNWVDNLSNRVSPKYRRWVKAAIIIIIVLLVLAVIGMLWCIISCLCCPLCCCIRAVK